MDDGAYYTAEKLKRKLWFRGIEKKSFRPRMLPKISQ